MRIKLNDGKYEVINEIEKGVFKALRHGREWRNLVGDNLILAMCYEIEELQNKVSKYEKALKEIEEHNEYYSGNIAAKALDNYPVANSKSVDLAKQVRDYEEVLRLVEGTKAHNVDLALEAKQALNKHNPHRSCPDCREDCPSWVAFGEACGSSGY